MTEEVKINITASPATDPPNKTATIQKKEKQTKRRLLEKLKYKICNKLDQWTHELNDFNNLLNGNFVKFEDKKVVLTENLIDRLRLISGVLPDKYIKKAIGLSKLTDVDLYIIFYYTTCTRCDGILNFDVMDGFFSLMCRYTPELRNMHNRITKINYLNKLSDLGLSMFKDVDWDYLFGKEGE